MPLTLLKESPKPEKDVWLRVRVARTSWALRGRSLLAAARHGVIGARLSINHLLCDFFVVAGVAHLRVLVGCRVFALSRPVMFMRAFLALTLSHFELLYLFEAPVKPQIHDFTDDLSH